MSLARGCLGRQAGAPGPRAVDAIVLTTLGLFFESCWDGWIKAEDYILERVLAEAPGFKQVDPWTPAHWPERLREAFDRWPRAWLPPWTPFADDPLEVLTFMFGQPYDRKALDTDLWVEVVLQRALQWIIGGKRYKALGRMFGKMHLGMYLHIGQMVRRGYAAPYDTLDIVDRPRVEKLTPARATSVQRRPSLGVLRGTAAYLDPEPFRDRRITLIGGSENRLWHRDSVDLMYEWLLSNAGGRGHRFKKLILAGYGHQDLFWGPESKRHVYEKIHEAIA
jgi:hypothetical protein